MPDEQHVYHHSDKTGPTVNVSATRNTKGWNYEATVNGAESVEQALALLAQATDALEARYGSKEA